MDKDIVLEVMLILCLIAVSVLIGSIIIYMFHGVGIDQECKDMGYANGGLLFTGQKYCTNCSIRNIDKNGYGEKECILVEKI